jgi:hypothetical protein
MLSVFLIFCVGVYIYIYIYIYICVCVCVCMCKYLMFRKGDTELFTFLNNISVICFVFYYLNFVCSCMV